MRELIAGWRLKPKLLTLLREANDRFGWLLTIVAIPSLINDLSWWIDLINFIYATAPIAVIECVKLIGEGIEPAVRIYSTFVSYLFSFMPFQVPPWLAKVVPPSLSLSLSAGWTYYRFKAFKRVETRLRRLRDKRFETHSVLMGMIVARELRFPRDWAPQRMPSLDAVLVLLHPYLVKLEKKSRRQRIFFIVYAVTLFSVLIAELAYQLVK